MTQTNADQPAAPAHVRSGVTELRQAEKRARAVRQGLQVGCPEHRAVTAFLDQQALALAFTAHAHAHCALFALPERTPAQTAQLSFHHGALSAVALALVLGISYPIPRTEFTLRGLTVLYAAVTGHPWQDADPQPVINDAPLLLKSGTPVTVHGTYPEHLGSNARVTAVDAAAQLAAVRIEGTDTDLHFHLSGPLVGREQRSGRYVRGVPGFPGGGW